MGARRLVADGEVERADLVVAVLAAAGLDVVQSGVVVQPGADGAADIGVDAVGGHEGQFAGTLLVKLFVVNRKAKTYPSGVLMMEAHSLMGASSNSAGIPPPMVGCSIAPTPTLR
jgi:hypothetical protein